MSAVLPNRASAFDALLADLRSNRRLHWGIAIIALILLGYALLVWSDNVERSSKQLRKLQGEISSLKAQSRDTKPWQERIAEIKQQRRSLDKRLWVNPSEAAVQARLRDWLTEIAKSSIANRYLVTLGSVTNATRDASGGAVTEGTLPEKLKQYKASLSFDFTPASLEAVLLAIEGGGQFAVVDTLSVNKRAKRVEVNVIVFARLGEQGSDFGQATQGTSALPSASAATDGLPFKPPSVPQKISASTTLPNTIKLIAYISNDTLSTSNIISKKITPTRCEVSV
jgi:hypothetical protein